MNEEEIIQKVRNFLEKKEGLDVEPCYFITKKLNEQYWDEIQGEEEISEDDESFDDFEDKGESPEITGGYEGDEEDPEEEEIDVVQEVKPKPKKEIIKKPRIKIKK